MSDPQPSIQQLKSLPPVSEMMRTAGLEPKKSLGQNFLFDLNLTRKIARAVPNLERAVVLEVGPGPGGLTRALLECGAKKVIAVEKDKNAAPILDEIQKAGGGRLDVVYGDALKIIPFAGEDPSGQGGVSFPADGISICSNLPYNVGTELLIKWLHFPDKIKSMTLMFQREVADRIAAQPGGKQYGRLSVLASLGWRAKILFGVPNTAFCPPPKVQSAVVQLIPAPFDGDIGKVEKLTARLFGQRRKMIRSIMPNVDWAEFGLAGTERAEELPPETFARLAKFFL
jgi:16S rRNA (adenine1518-N6/adenine1519-N6)-dimethyltransferase